MSITYEYMVDWDAVDWRATPDFSEAIDDISDYVKSPMHVNRVEKENRWNSYG